MYNEILEGLYQARNVKTGAAQASYLSSLIPTMRLLHDSYYSERVEVDYSNAATQAAYMLRYYPPYTKLLPKVLGDLRAEFDQSYLKASFFGAGPGPELFGAIRFLERTKTVHHLEALLFDNSSGTWTLGRAIAEERVIPSSWHPGSLDIHHQHSDIAQAWPNDGETLAGAAGSQLVVLQNCLNEIEEHETLFRNLAALGEALPRSAKLVFIDFSKWDSVTKLLLALRGLPGFRVRLQGIGAYDSRMLWNEIPEAILESGLIVVRKDGFAPITPSESGLLMGRRVHYQTLVLEKR